jgi:hypothetical protein
MNTFKRARLYGQVFSSPEGKLVLLELLRECGLLECALELGDPNTTAFNVGKQAIGQHLLQNLRYSEGELLALARAQTTTEIVEAREGASGV